MCHDCKERVGHFACFWQHGSVHVMKGPRTVNEYIRKGWCCKRFSVERFSTVPFTSGDSVLKISYDRKG
jgi:hypothetical protein